MIVGLFVPFSQSNQSGTAPSSKADAKPLLLEKNEGELRTRRIHSDNSPTASPPIHAEGQPQKQ
jgi:hypothetical protein